MKKLLLIISVVMSMMLVGCGGKQTSNKDEVVKLGVIEAMTGNKAMSGMYAKEGAELFLEHINANGGILGKKVEIVYEDDQGNERIGTNAFQKLLAEHEDLSGVVLSKYSSVVLAMEPFIAEAKVPAIAAGSSVRIEELANDWVYAVRKSDNGAGISIALAAADLGMTKVAIIHSPDALGTGMAPVITNQLSKHGIAVASTQQFSTDEKNFGPYIAKIKDASVDGVIVIAQQTEAALIMIALEEAGLKIPGIGSSASAQQTTLQNAGDAANGFYAVTAWAPTITTEPAKTWIDQYKAKFNQAPDMGSVLTYDALMLLAKAMEAAKSTDPVKVNEAMQTLKNAEGIASTYTFRKGTRMLAMSEFLVEIKDGKAIVIDTVVEK